MKRFISVVALLGAAGAASASTTYYGLDAGVGPAGPWPTMAAAAGNWDTDAAAFAPIYRQDYESFALADGNLASLDVTVAGGPVVLVGQSAPDGGSAGIRDNAFWGGFGETVLGFNTTAGGAKFYEQCGPFGVPNTTTFVFRTPVVGFGTVITGLQRFGGDLLVSINGGGFDVIEGAGNSTAEGGGALFWGVLDVPISFISFTIANGAGDGTRDLFGFDDTRWVVPTPGAAGLFGLGALAMARRRR